MARKSKSASGSDAYAEPRPASAEAYDIGSLVEALRQVTDVLVTVGDSLDQVAKASLAGTQARGASGDAVALAAKINTWDDPFTEPVASTNPALAAVTAVPLEPNRNPRLRTAIVEPQPPPARYNPGTPGFRYWVTAEAVSRGISFWEAVLPTGTTWSTSNPMRVALVEAGQDLNARYRRMDGLHFYRRPVGGFDVHSCESPDVVCHELGHAILDALKPQLFNAGDPEIAAFHESFGDISAILCALQVPSLCRTVLAETSGRLNVTSRLSRVAEQLGWAIRQLSPTAVDRDSLRNAANRFFYRRIDTLPPSAPANLLSSEAHSFSRVFTGAFLDILARMVATAGVPNEASVVAVSRDLGQLVVDAVHAAPIRTGYFTQVAAAMIKADQARFGGRYRSALNGSFIERGILSVGSAVAVADAPMPSRTPARAEGWVTFEASAGSAFVYSYGERDPDESFRRGLGETPELPLRSVPLAGGVTVDVHAPDEPAVFEVAPAAAGVSAESNVDFNTSARIFLEGLVTRREIDLGPSASLLADPGSKDGVRVTHSLVTENGKTVLKRNHFNCGFCQAGVASLLCI
jgi:hypothetical protein